ncbi:MAG: hyalin, partial [Phycisphaerales bacterium]|nr:hyalin [Phycisphaerales bacterium]
MSDGTVAGTQALRDRRQGLVDPRFDWLTAVGNAVLFAADDGMVGLEPWQSDGTVAGTRVAANVHTSAATQGAGSAPTFFLPARAATVFDADDGQRGREPWRTDGTAAGTVPLGELVPGAGGSRLVALGGSRGEALFASMPGGSLRADYYASDGTGAGTRRLATASL